MRPDASQPPRISRSSAPSDSSRTRTSRGTKPASQPCVRGQRICDLDQGTRLAETGRRMHEAAENRRALGVGGCADCPVHELGAEPMNVVERHQPVLGKEKASRSFGDSPGRQFLLLGIEQEAAESLPRQRGRKRRRFARQPLGDTFEHGGYVVSEAGVEDVERQRDQAGIEIGVAYRYDLALVGRAHGFGIDPVGRDGALSPHHDDGLRLIQRARDFRTEPVAAAQPRLIPPHRPGAEMRLDVAGKGTRQIAVL